VNSHYQELTPIGWDICILAGGLSSRMGRDKARLRLGRRTLLGHVRAAAGSLGLPVRVIRRDLVPRCGPLGGMVTGLRTTRATAVLFFSCDMPFVSPQLLREVMGGLDSPGAARRNGVFVRFRGAAGFPLALRRETLAVVERQIAAGELSLQALARRLRARSIRVPAGRKTELFNVNTPEDWARARALSATSYSLIRVNS